MNRKKHWEQIYETKFLEEVSWYLPVPEVSLDFIENSGVPKTAKILDVGGGDSFLVDHLLHLGYLDISVLDISETAIEKAKERLGEQAKKVKWIVEDIANFHPDGMYDLWHDRAAFHFLTDEKEISDYVRTVGNHIVQGGFLVIGTFSEKGPKKCSGIEIQQYSDNTMTDLFKPGFERIKCIYTDHTTPSGSIQNFVFCSFRKV
ncbi:class I SAM-dependent methyltransferase [Sinomicrobium sp. M5D2P17]